jgi:hypothetical protein
MVAEVAGVAGEAPGPAEPVDASLELAGVAAELAGVAAELAGVAAEPADVVSSGTKPIVNDPQGPAHHHLYFDSVMITMHMSLFGILGRSK